MYQSKRIQQVEASKTVQLAVLVAKLRAEGKKIISLNVGEPDFDTNDAIKEATKKALDNNQTKYSAVLGLPELRDLIAAKLTVDNSFSVKRDNILVGNGSKHLLNTIFQVLLDADDEVIIPAPYWMTFTEIVKLAGGQPRVVKTKSDYQLDIDAINGAITKKTKAILINSPNNPTSAVYNLESLQKLSDLCLEHDLVVISDEAYQLLTFDDQKHVSIASLDPKMRRRVIQVQSFSKSFCMTGFRVGYVQTDEDLIRSMSKLHSHQTGNVCTFAQMGAISALQMDKTIMQDMISEFAARAKFSFDLFSQLFVDMVPPQGAFYLFPNVEKYMAKHSFASDVEFVYYLIERAQVAVVPGSSFGMPGFIRISFAASRDDIKRGFEQMREVL